MRVADRNFKDLFYTLGQVGYRLPVMGQICWPFIAQFGKAAQRSRDRSRAPSFPNALGRLGRGSRDVMATCRSQKRTQKNRSDLNVMQDVISGEKHNDQHQSAVSENHGNQYSPPRARYLRLHYRSNQSAREEKNASSKHLKEKRAHGLRTGRF